MPDCVRVETGDKIGQFRQGLNARLKNRRARPTTGPRTAADFHDFFRTTTSRTIRATSRSSSPTTAGSTSQGSSQAVPVKYFAGFYITGWDKVGNNPECADNEPHPWYPSGYRKSLDNGDVWGHFINVVVFSASGTPDDNSATSTRSAPASPFSSSDEPSERRPRGSVSLSAVERGDGADEAVSEGRRVRS